MFDEHHLKLLLRWLMYYCKDPKTYHSMCLINKYCGLVLAREYVVGKKREFTCLYGVFEGQYVMCHFLPNGDAHGEFVYKSLLVDDGDKVYDYFVDGKLMLSELTSGFSVLQPRYHELKRCGNLILSRGPSKIWHLYNINDWVNYTHSIPEVQILPCICKRFHIFIVIDHGNNDKYYVFACKCDEQKLRIYSITNRWFWNISDKCPGIYTINDYLYHHFQSRKTKIRKAVCDYAKKIKIGDL